MPHANILLHQSSHYRRESFGNGLKAHGYNIINDRAAQPREGDVLVIWNRGNSVNNIARKYERRGGIVLVAENGFIGDTKAIARWHHCGAGEWHVGEEDRWSQLDIEVKPWRADGKHILVLPQRSIGEPGIAMPRNWIESVTRRLKRITDRPIVVRKHPGKNVKRELELDLHNAWCSVVWASGAGIKSIVAGVPVFHDLKNWIGAPAASCNWNIEEPFMGDRCSMLHRLAWAQWTWAEIESGQCFEYLLKR
jgi:hypothetical protein